LPLVVHSAGRAEASLQSSFDFLVVPLIAVLVVWLSSSIASLPSFAVDYDQASRSVERAALAARITL